MEEGVFTESINYAAFKKIYQFYLHVRTMNLLFIQRKMLGPLIHLMKEEFQHMELRQVVTPMKILKICSKELIKLLKKFATINLIF